jgi:hypothetical protein
VLVTAGALGVDADASVGFDIYSTLKDGVTVRNSGFAALSSGDTSALYRIDLLTGKASLLGRFGVPVVDIALPLDQ